MKQELLKHYTIIVDEDGSTTGYKRAIIRARYRVDDTSIFAPFGTKADVDDQQRIKTWVDQVNFIVCFCLCVVNNHRCTVLLRPVNFCNKNFNRIMKMKQQTEWNY